jgi:8-oxo-dGTP pyrophosphatase MutT (NUDIX family)
VRGVYDALTAPGAELPTAGVWNIEGDKADLLNAHISVMTADEVNKIGPDKINERGHMFGYSMGALKEIEQPANHLSRVWAIQVSSPALSALRKSYGLSALPNGDHAFHITVAVRRKNVLKDNDVSRFDVASGRGELKAAEVQPRVRVVMPYKNQYLMETLNNSKWPQNIGKRRFMGGGIEQGETPEQAASREMFEELGVKIKPTAFRPLGNDPREGWQHEHYLELLKHKLKPGNFNASVGSDAVVTLSHGLPTGEDYMGPNIKALLAPALKKAASAAENKHSNTLSRSGQKDLLPGGKADNVPDREFSPHTLAEGQKDEREHTSNDQVAKEIAKDHLLKDPQHYKKETLMEKVTAPQMPAIVRLVTKQAESVYLNQAMNTLNMRNPIKYDHTKPVFENIQNQMQEMKRRGDFIMQARRNHETYMSALSPQYRYQRMMQAFHNKLPQENPLDTMIENYGDSALNQMGGLYGQHSR